MLEQRVADAKQRLEKLQGKQRELFAARRLASLRILSHSNAIIWEKAKQRYRLKIDENGMRTVLLVGALFAALVLPFAFFAAIFDALVLGALASVAAVIGILTAYRIVLCGTDEGTQCRIQKHEEAKSKAEQVKEDLQVANEANGYDIQVALEQLADLEPELARQRAIEEEERRRNEFTNLSKILLNERWKELRSVDFEKYVERVFQHLGYQTEETPVTGDQGVDLVVIAENLRMAVQVKGYYNSVSNSAVQEVVAGMNFHRCNRTCVVINSRFTSSAEQIAEANHCQCIDENNFEDFVYGRIFPRVRSLAAQGSRHAIAPSFT